MAYLSFTQQRLFKNSSLNLACNKIYTALQEQGGEREFSLALTGTISKIVQEAIPPEPIKVIPFVINDPEIFKYLKKNLGGILKIKEVILYKTSIHFKVKGNLLEIHYDENFKSIYDYEGIICQQVSEIPPKYN